MKCAIAYVGHKLSNEIEDFKIAFAKNMENFSGNTKLEYVYSLMQFSMRNFNLRNVLFVIDWRVMLAVIFSNQLRIFYS